MSNTIKHTHTQLQNLHTHKVTKSVFKTEAPGFGRRVNQMNWVKELVRDSRTGCSYRATKRQQQNRLL